jgi:hypothetical protein
MILIGLLSMATSFSFGVPKDYIQNRTEGHYYLNFLIENFELSRVHILYPKFRSQIMTTS